MKHRFGQHHVAQMGDATVIRIVRHEDIAFRNRIAIAREDRLDGFVENTDERRDPGPGTDHTPRSIRHAGAHIEHFIDDRAHRGLAQNLEHLLCGGVEPGLDHACRERVRH